MESDNKRGRNILGYRMLRIVFYSRRSSPIIGGSGFWPHGAEGGAKGQQPTVNDYNKLADVINRLRNENKDALHEIDHLVGVVRD